MVYTMLCVFFFFNDTATTEIYTLSLHDALPIWDGRPVGKRRATRRGRRGRGDERGRQRCDHAQRSEEHTSELQSRQYLVCRLLLDKTTRYESLCGSLAAAHGY